MQFIDEAKIIVTSGGGGNGCVSFRREKFIEFGGPDGGNGGNGGSVIFRATTGMNTLLDYRYQQHHKARRGTDGMGRNRTGPGGEDLILEVPVGTEVRDNLTDTLLFDLTEPGQEAVFLEGGRGGRGNASYKSSVNQAPRQFTKGEPSEEREVRLRLKLLADVGLLGLPNAGKSTFISAVSNARPKVADYPFTTLAPNLGVVRHHNTDMVLADLPGLIEGASQGVGLGHQFLKHLSRCAAVLHMVDITHTEPAEAYKTIRAELKAYDKDFGTELSNLPEIIALSKADALPSDEAEKCATAFKKKVNKTPVILSSATRLGVDQVLTKLTSTVAKREEVTV